MPFETMSEEKAEIPSTREELEAARTCVLEQLRTLEYAPVMGSDRVPYKTALRKELGDILNEMDDRLAALGSVDGETTNSP